MRSCRDRRWYITLNKSYAHIISTGQEIIADTHYFLSLVHYYLCTSPEGNNKGDYNVLDTMSFP